MLMRPLRLWLSLLALVFAVGCYRADANGDGLNGGGTDVMITAKFEKKVLGPGGWSGTEIRPASYCYVEVRRDSDDTVLAADYLGASGQGMATLPAGTRVYLALHATVEVPSQKGAPVVRGGAKLAQLSSVYGSSSEFTGLPDAFVVTQPITVGQGSLNVTVPASTPEAGAFNVVDQIVTFGEAMDAAEKQALKLPSIHAFLSTSYTTTTYPTPARVGSSSSVLIADDPHKRSSEAADPRIAFQFKVRRALQGAADAGADAFNDSELQRDLCHMLFESYSFSQDGRPVFRRDNDNDYVSPNIASEPAIAFVNGFCDFLSCAFRGSNSLQDIDADGTVHTFYLDRHAQFPMGTGGEFYSGAISVSLYGIWKNVLGSANFWPLYDAALASGPGEYNSTTLACYPTFLQGLRSKSGASWGAILGELSKEQIGDVTSAAYFNAGILWSNQSVPFQAPGSLSLVGNPSYVYDLGAQKCYHVLHSGNATRRLTLTFPAGRDMIVDVYSTAGWIGGTTLNGGGTSRQLDLNLGSGEYLVRVRAGYYNTATGSWSYTLSLQ